MMRRLLPLAALATLGCSDILLTPPAPAALVLSADTVRLAPGEIAELTFIVKDDAGRLVYAPTAKWKSLDPTIVTVDSVGGLLGGVEGTGRVVAQAAGVGDSALVIVHRDWLSASGSCMVRGDGLPICFGVAIPGAPAGVIAATAGSNGFAERGDCVLASSTVIWCRGSDYYGDLGDGLPVDTSPTRFTRSTYAPVSGPSGYTSLYSGGGVTYCGLRGTEIYCWGYDLNGTVGNDTARANVPTPTIVAGGLAFSSIADESDYPRICGTASGQLWCWGSYSPGPQFAVPAAMTPDVGLVRASVGYYHSCGLDVLGQAWCWGVNDQGQLGRGTFGAPYTPDSIPQPVSTALRFLDIAVSYYATCGVTTTHEIECWGQGRYGQLGQAGVAQSSLPLRVPTVQHFASIRTDRGEGFCALTDGGAEYCWGYYLGVNLDTRPEDYLPKRTPSPF